jgi:hypothetical protein
MNHEKFKFTPETKKKSPQVCNEEGQYTSSKNMSKNQVAQRPKDLNAKLLSIFF